MNKSGRVLKILDYLRKDVPKTKRPLPEDVQEEDALLDDEDDEDLPLTRKAKTRVFDPGL